MVIGTAGELPKPPPQPVVFMEDMTDAQLAQAVRPPSPVLDASHRTRTDVFVGGRQLTSPAGLDNLGNTCYLNSTVQVLKAIPELQSSLNAFTPSSSSSTSLLSTSNPGATSLTLSLRDLYKALGSTQDSYSPWGFLESLRRFAPQFAERSRQGGGFSQQDAEECWTQIVGAVKNTLNVATTEGAAGSEGAVASSTGPAGKFVDRYMTGEMTTECVE